MQARGGRWGWRGWCCWRGGRGGRAGSTRAAVSLSYRIFGEHPAESAEPPVFLLHGLLGGKRQWEGVAKTLGSVARRGVVALDLRNHGASPHAAPHAYEALAADVARLRRRLAVRRASLVGHSMGGRAGMAVALLEPQTVAGLLVIDISPVSSCAHLREHLPRVLAAMRALRLREQRSVAGARREARERLQALVADPQLLQAVLANLEARADHTIGWRCNLDLLIEDFEHIAGFPETLLKKEYSGPTLFVGGQLSEYIPGDDLPAIRALFPRAVVTYVPRARHAPHADHPQAFLELAINFLKTN